MPKHFLPLSRKIYGKFYGSPVIIAVMGASTLIEIHDALQQINTHLLKSINLQFFINL